jgi:hypothetical protein
MENLKSLSDKKPGIYHEPEMDHVTDYYDRDIVKVLTKNPREVFIFWGISSASFAKIIKELDSNRENIRLQLIVNFNIEKRHAQQIINLPPFTNSWILRFDTPVRNFQAELAAYSVHTGAVYTLLHSAVINMPSSKPSVLVHKEWINDNWKKPGVSFEFLESQGEVESKDYWKEILENKEEAEKLLLHRNVSGQPDEKESIPSGSSGFMGSSNLSSWGRRE